MTKHVSNIHKPATKARLAVALVLGLLLAACGGPGGGGGGGGGGEDRGVAVSPGSFSLEVGETQLLTAVVAEGEGSQAVDWSSSNVSVATVDASGLVSAVAAGNAVVTAVSQADTSLSGTARVQVTAPSCRAPVNIDADIIDSTTLARLDHAAGCTDYYVEFMRQVRQPLTIEPGVTIEFGMGAGFFVTVLNGSLNAVGTAELPVTFKLADSAPLPWSGLIFGTNSVDNKLHHVVISGTGAPVTDAVYPRTLRSSVIVANSYSTSISHTEFRGGAGYAVWLGEGALLAEFSNNTFAGLAEAPIALDMSQLKYLPAGSTFHGPIDDPNARDEIDLLARQLTEDAVVTAFDVPYRLLGDFDANRSYTVIGSVLTIGEGVEMLFGPGAGIRVQDDGGAGQGAIKVLGGASEPVVMTADVEGAGPDYWEGISISSTGVSQIVNASIGFGGGRTGLTTPDNHGANVIVHGDGVLSISGTHLHDAPYCLEVIGAATSVTFGSGISTDGCVAAHLP